MATALLVLVIGDIVHLASLGFYCSLWFVLASMSIGSGVSVSNGGY